MAAFITVRTRLLLVFHNQFCPRCPLKHEIFVSLGGLGKGSSLACVSNVSVDSIIAQTTLYGIRIKTWQVAVIKFISN